MLRSLAVVLCLAPLVAHAQQHMHMTPAPHPAAAPTQTGQAAFAAIQEIVGILEADPNTDW